MFSGCFVDQEKAGMKLLLLEDDDLLAESLAELLEDNGYRLDVSSI